jgi:hypothetical protein
MGSFFPLEPLGFMMPVIGCERPGPPDHGSSAVAVGGLSGVECAPNLVGEGYRDEACL